MSSYLETVKLKRQKALEEQSRIQAQKSSQQVVSGLGKVSENVSSLHPSKHKQTDFDGHFGRLSDKVAELGEKVQGLDSKDLSQEQISAIRELQEGLNSLKFVIQASNMENEKQTHEIITAIRELDLSTTYSPEINVPEPKVSVTTQKVDLSPLEKTIRETFKPQIIKPEIIERTVEVPVEKEVVIDRFDLTRYTAQDLKETEGRQYVGFVNPEGDWYILENDIKGNKMRYVFGSGAYSKHFKSASSFKYELLDKAVAHAS